MENTLNPVDAWHLSLEKSDPKILYDVLDDSFEFFSPFKKILSSRTSSKEGNFLSDPFLNAKFQLYFAFF